MKSSLLFYLLIALISASVPLSAQELDPDFAPRFQVDSGVVYGAVELSDGGYLVGGSFDYLGEVYSPNLARILPDGSVDTNFNLQLDGYVRCIFSDGAGGFLIGGGFATIGGAYQPYLVKLDSSLELDTVFNANLGSGPDSTVSVISFDESGNLLVGGYFTSFDGHTSRGVVRLLSDGNVDNGFTTPFVSTTRVNDLAFASDGDLYVVGYFLDAGGQGFNHIALLNPDGSLDSSFDPGVGASSTILAVEILPDGDLLIGGTFNVFNNQLALYWARLNPDGSRDTSLVGNAYSNIRSIQSLDDGRFLIGGEFTNYFDGSNYQSIRGIALLESDLTLSAQQPSIDWDGSSNIFGFGFATSGEVLVCGTAEIAGTTPARGIFTFDLSTDTVTGGWQVWGTGVVHALWVDDDGSVVAGGRFSHVNGVEAPALARITPTGELDLSFASGLTDFNEVYTLKSHQSGLLVGGYFSNIGGESYRGLARIDPATGAVDTTFAMTQDPVYPIVRCLEVLPDDRVFVGGDNLAGPDNNNASNLIFLDVDGTRLLEWPEADGPNATVRAIARAADGSIWVGGAFSQWAGESKRLERLDSSFNYDPAFSAGQGPNSTVVAIHGLPDGKLLIGGSFSSFSGTSGYRRLARISGEGILDMSFTNLGLSSSVLAIASDDQGRILVGGAFTSGGGFTLPRITRMSADGVLDSSVFVGKTTDNLINAIAVDGDRIHLGGYFKAMDGEVSAAFASFAIPDGAPVITAHPEEVAVATGGDALFSVAVTGDAPLSFQWLKGGVVVAGATASSLSLTNVDAADAGVYQVEVSNAVGTTLSAGAALLVDPWPVITTQPQGGSFRSGDPVALSVAVAGVEPLSYQWYRGSASSTSNPVAGGTSSSLSFNYSGSEEYWVRVSNAYGSTDSNTAYLSTYTPPSPPSISPNLSNQTVNAGDSATFTVSASGDTPLSYAWTRDGSPLAETGSSLTIFNVSAGSAGTYRVVVSNSAGTDSSQAVLSVRTTPEFQAQPISKSANEGDNVTFSASVDGPGPLTYQWQKNGNAIAGATSLSLQINSVTGSDAGSYSLLATNSFGTTASSTATLTVNSPPTISSHPGSANVPTGGSAILSVSAGGTAPLTYAWYRGASGNTGDPVGTSASSLDTGALSETTSYWVRITNAYGSADSNTAVVTVGDPPSFTGQPSDLSVSIGQTASFTASATGDGTISYQWFKGGFTMNGRTASSLILSSVSETDAGEYFVRATSVFGSADSSVATLTVRVPPSIETQPQSLSVALNETALFEVIASGTATLSYQWLRNDSPLSGETSSQLSIAAVSLSDAGDYRVRVSNGEGQVLSQIATLTVNRPPAITAQPEGQTYVAAGDSAELDVSAEGSAPLSYQWYEGSAGDTSVPLSGATGTSFVSGALDVSTSFWVRVTNPYGNADSATAEVSVGNPPSIITQPESVESNVGDTVQLSVGVSGDGPFTYQWKKDGDPIVDATGEQLLITEAVQADSGDYSVVVENLFGQATSDSVSVSVSELVAPEIISNPSNRTVAPGDSVTFSVTASGTAPLTYQWFRGDLPLSGETGSELILNPISVADAGEYWCRVSNDVGSADSTRATLEVMETPLLTQQPGTTTIATGASTTITVVASGGGTLAYQWYAGSSGDTSVPVGTNSSEYTTPALTTSSQYWVRVSNEVGQADSGAATITVMDPVTILTHPQNLTVAENELAVLSVSASGGGTLSYEWSFNGEVIEGPNEATYSFTALFNTAGAYTVKVSNQISQVTSNTAELTVQAPPFFLEFPQDQTLESGQALTLTVLADGSPTLSYAWALDGQVLEGENSSTLLLDPVGVADAGTYTATVSNAFGSVDADAVVTVEGAPELSSINAPSQVDYGSNAQLSISAVGPGPFQYLWYAGASGDTSELLTTGLSSYTTGALTEESSFWVRVTNTFGSTDSQTATIDVIQETPVIQSPVSATAAVGSLFTYRILATEGPISFNASPLPEGFGVNTATGLISGVAESQGVYEIGLAASNETKTGTATLILTVHPARPIHTGFDTVRGLSGDTLSLTLSTVNPVDAINFPNLPDWLSYDSASGTLSGNAPAPGEYRFQLVLTNAGGSTVQEIVFVVNSRDGAPKIISEDFAAGRQGEAFSFFFEAEPAATEFEITGALPSGVIFNAFTGELSGVPQESGAFVFSIRARDGVGFGPAKTFTLEISLGVGLPVITNLIEQRGYVAELFELTLEATNTPTSFEARNLPPGISLIEHVGTGEWRLSGTPGLVESTTASIRAVNAQGPGEWKDIEIDIRAGRVMPVVSSGTIAVGRDTVSFSFQLQATETPIAFYATGLPDGLILDSETGEITGTPTSAGDYSVSVKAENIDGIGPSLGMRFEIDVEPGAPLIKTEPIFIGRQNLRFNELIRSTEDPVRFTALSNLPPGIGLDEETGRLAGVPSAKGTYEFTVEAESAFGFVSQPTVLTMVVRGPHGTPNVTSAMSIEGRLDEALNYSLSSDVAYSEIELGDLPPGLSFSNGLISGAPTEAGEFVVPVQLSNSSGAGVETILSFSILPGDAQPRISGLAAVELDYAQPFDLQVVAVNGPIEAWKFVGLPPGLDYDATTGQISGRPARVGTFDAFLSASNVNGFGRAQLVRFLVRADPTAPVVVSPRSVSGSVASQISYQIQASNLIHTRPLPSGYYFRASGLPTGVLVDSGTGLIQGTPAAAGIYNAKVWVETPDSSSQKMGVTFEIINFNDVSFRLFGPSFVSTTVGEDLVVKLQGNGPIASSYFVYFGDDSAFKAEIGKIRDHYHADADRMFAYIPGEKPGNIVTLKTASTGARQFFFQSINNTNFIATTVHILPSPDNAVVTTPSDHYLVTGDTVSIPVTVSQPVAGGFAYPVLATELPTGLWYDESSALIRGTLSVPGTYSFQVAAVNDFGRGLPKDIRIFVAPVEAAPTINAVSENLEPLAASSESEALRMMALAAPEMMDSTVMEASSADAAIMVNGIAGEFLDFSIDAGSGVLEYRAEGLPPGIVLNLTSGDFSGVPERPGQWTASLSARNAQGWGAAVEVGFSIAAAEGSPVITSSASLTAQVGVSFNHTLLATPAADSYNIEGEGLGLTIDPVAGTIEGTFDSAGTYTWSISGNNEVGEGAAQELTVVVSPAVGTPEVVDPGLLTGRVGEAFTYTFTASGLPTAWAVNELPLGLSLDAETGVISGTPLQIVESSYLVQATNETGTGSATEVSFQIEPSLNAPVMTNDSTISVRAGDSVNFSLEASNNPVAFGAGPLPSGLTLDSTTGLLSGTMMTEGNYILSFRGVNEHGEGPVQSVSLEVLPALVSFDDWAAALPEGFRGISDEPFGWGIPNGLLFALGMSLDRPERERLPVVELFSQGEEDYISIVFTRSTEVGGIEYFLKGDSSLDALVEVPSSVEVLSYPANGLEQVRMRQETPITGEDRWFLNLNVQRQAE